MEISLRVVPWDGKEVVLHELRRERRCNLGFDSPCIKRAADLDHVRRRSTFQAEERMNARENLRPNTLTSNKSRLNRDSGTRSKRRADSEFTIVAKTANFSDCRLKYMMIAYFCKSLAMTLSKNLGKSSTFLCTGRGCLSHDDLAHYWRLRCITLSSVKHQRKLCKK